MESFARLLSQMRDFWRRLGANQKVTVVLSMIVFAGVSVGILVWSGRPDYVLLFSNLSAEDAWSVVESLNKEGVPYKFSQNGSAIHVPSRDVYRLRISLAASGLPKSSELGYEIFDRKGGFGVSDFVQQVNYQRALEGELARTIAGLDDVEHARVHLTMPKETLFQEEEARTSASVVVTLGSGRSLDEREIAGIAHLVASSVPRLDPERVVVIDARGRILSAPSDEESVAGLSKGQLETQRRIEEYLSKKTEALLEGALGQGKAIVRVNADLDFRQMDETRELYDPANAAVRSEERVEEAGEGAAAGSAERSITNYELNRTIQRILGAAGSVRRLSVAVFVDGKWTQDPAAKKGAPLVYQPRSQEEIDKLAALVKTAVGFDEARGDRVEIANLPFESEGAAVAAGTGGRAAAATAGWKGAAGDALRTATPFLILLAVLFFLRKTMAQVGSALAEKKESLESNLLPDRPLDEAEARKMEIRNRVEQLAVERPSEVAALIRTWMMED